jgi:hypothetical protein
MLRYLAITLLIILFVFSIRIAEGYEVIKVKNGATLKGVVKVKGKVPKAETVVIKEDTQYCGKVQKINKYIISDSRIKDVVVWIDDINKGKAIPKKTVEIILKRCKAKPLVNVGFVGGNYLFRNEDSILHTLQLKLELKYQKKVSGRPLENGATIYNFALPKKGMQIEKPIKRYHRYSEDTGFIRLTSNTHNWIRGYIFIFDHPYAAITDRSGIFVIEDLPPGEYVLKAWHEGLGIQEKKIKVTPGEVVEIEIEFSI